VEQHCFAPNTTWLSKYLLSRARIKLYMSFVYCTATYILPSSLLCNILCNPSNKESIHCIQQNNEPVKSKNPSTQQAIHQRKQSIHPTSEFDNLIHRSIQTKQSIHPQQSIKQSTKHLSIQTKHSIHPQQSIKQRIKHPAKQ